ncbi:hypothetical protein DAPPUDRAFT_321803 [Daphnia pulex]|uniref:Uncharacterized protein n=1 Tax=Daphnia pulex TaxID=6669 RepID=E9GTY8_DAPPU|nr:hypothetical protein DAPPUDRAFT_321803 [Daphnia pulex]|eukprot:EFX76941.1 hypothetical protein DAPPUDRAFT_321803 [Daphnia pulex]
MYTPCSYDMNIEIIELWNVWVTTSIGANTCLLQDTVVKETCSREEIYGGEQTIAVKVPLITRSHGASLQPSNPDLASNCAGCTEISFSFAVMSSSCLLIEGQ